jgi:hypothetical protein
MLFSVILLCKVWVWMNRSFDASSNIDVMNFVLQFVVSYGMFVGGGLLVLFAFGLLT